MSGPPLSPWQVSVPAAAAQIMLLVISLVVYSVLLLVHAALDIVLQTGNIITRVIFAVFKTYILINYVENISLTSWKCYLLDNCFLQDGRGISPTGQCTPPGDNTFPAQFL